MYSVPHLNAHNDLPLSFFRGVTHLLEKAKSFCIYWSASFERAKKAQIAYELDPYNSEEIKRIMFEE